MSLNKNLSIQVLLESMLYSYICANYEQMKAENPIIANLVRKDLTTLHRNHEIFMSKFRPILGAELLTDFERLEKIIEDFLKSDE